MDNSLLRKSALRFLSVLGVVIFGFFMLLTYHTPEWVEQFAAEFIESEVAKKIDVALNKVQMPKAKNTLTQFAESILENNATKIASMKTALEEKVQEQMAGAIAQIRDLDCECREEWAQFLESGIEFNIGILEVANDKVVEFIQAEYVEVVEKLKRDIRVFLGTNLAVFLLLLVISFAKPYAISHLFLPGILLVVSTFICSYFYVFEQNWLLTLIYSDYVGFAYLTYLLIVFGFLSDIAFNRGRITSSIVNMVTNAIGSSVSLGPC